MAARSVQVPSDVAHTPLELTSHWSPVVFTTNGGGDTSGSAVMPVSAEWGWSVWVSIAPVANAVGAVDTSDAPPNTNNEAKKPVPTLLTRRVIMFQRVRTTVAAVQCRQSEAPPGSVQAGWVLI